MASSVDNDKKAAYQTREDYKAREVDLKRKQNQELNRLQKSQADQLREIQKTHQEQLETVRLRGQESLTNQDRKYQSEMDKIRTAHRQQSVNSAQETDARIKVIQSQHESELDKNEAIQKTREESAEKNNMRNFKQKEDEYNKSAEYMRNKQEEGLISERNKLENRYQNEGNELRKTQDEKIKDLSLNLQNTRDSKNAEIKELKTRLVSDKEDSESKKLDLLMQERKKAVQQQDYMSGQFEENLETLKEKYHAHNVNARSGRADELLNMQEVATARNREQVQALEGRIRNMKSEHEMDSFQTNNDFREERKTYLQENKKQQEIAEAQRSQIYDSANLKTKEEIRDITNRSNNVLDRQNKYYQSRINEMTDKYHESIETQVNSVELDNKKDLKAANMRQKKITDLMSQEKNNIEAHYQEMIEENDRVHKEDMMDMRSNMTRERNEAVRRLESRIRDLDAKSENKMNLLVQKYEKDIFDIKEQNKAEMKSTVTQYNKRIDELERNQKMIVDTSKIQSDSREFQLKEHYEKQIDNLRQTHEEERIRLTVKRS